MADPPIDTVGDRIERAIELKADTAGEIQRGERHKPRRLRRSIVWLGITGVSL
jgi:hypothetical protein